MDPRPFTTKKDGVVRVTQLGEIVEFAQDLPKIGLDGFNFNGSILYNKF
jgi:hypothetical protein